MKKRYEKVFVCVCVCERENEREKENERERARERLSLSLSLKHFLIPYNHIDALPPQATCASMSRKLYSKLIAYSILYSILKACIVVVLPHFVFQFVLRVAS